MNTWNTTSVNNEILRLLSSGNMYSMESNKIVIDLFLIKRIHNIISF